MALRLQWWLRTNWRVIAAPSVPCNAAELGGEALCRAEGAEFPGLGKILFADTVRVGSISAVCATLGLLQVCEDLCLFSLSSLNLGLGMLWEEEMWIYGPSQGQHVNNQYLESERDVISVQHRTSICAILY